MLNLQSALTFNPIPESQVKSYHQLTCHRNMDRKAELTTFLFLWIDGYTEGWGMDRKAELPTFLFLWIDGYTEGWGMDRKAELTTFLFLWLMALRRSEVWRKVPTRCEGVKWLDETKLHADQLPYFLD